MSRNYKIFDQRLPYFITSTVFNWIDVFTRNPYRDIVIDSLNFCRKHKGLKLYAYCIMTNHIHLIIGTKNEEVQNIVRDFKGYSSRELRKCIETNSQESRRQWIMAMMYFPGSKVKANKGFQFWQHHYHPIELSSEKLMNQKLE